MGTLPKSFELDTPSSFEPEGAPASFQVDSAPASFHPIDSAGLGGEVSYKGMRSSFDRGREAWLEFTKRPTVYAMMSVLAPQQTFTEDVAREVGVPELLSQQAEVRKKTIPKAPQASVGSVSDLNSAGNWLAFQIGSLPAQVGPGFLASLAGYAVGGKPLSAIAGASTSYIQNSGELYENLLEKGLSKQDAALYAQVGAIPMAMLDTAVPAWLAGKVMGKLTPKKLIADAVIEKAVKETALKAAAKKLGTVAGATAGEGLTEGLQEVIATGVESGTTDGRFLTPENGMRWLDSTLAGALMGGVVGGAVEMLPQAKSMKGRSLDDIRTEDAARQQAAETQKLVDPTTDIQEVIDQQRVEDDKNYYTPEAEKFWQEQEQRDLDATRRMLMEEEELTAAEEEAVGTLTRTEEPAVVTEIPVPQEATPTEAPAAPAEPPFPSIHEIINERNTEYHATDLEGFKGIVEAGQIGLDRGEQVSLVSYKGPAWQVVAKDGNTTTFPLEVYSDAEKLAKDLAKRTGFKVHYIKSPPMSAKYDPVSTSRIARVASKADKGITFVLDSSKMPPGGKPTTEQGYKKTITAGKNRIEAFDALATSEERAKLIEIERELGSVGSWEPQYEQLVAKRKSFMDSVLSKAKVLNERFEFENRYSAPVPLSAVKAILVDRSALKGDRGVASWRVLLPDASDYRFSTQKEAEAFAETHKEVRTLGGRQVTILPKVSQLEGVITGLEEAIAHVQQLAASKNIPVRIYESGKELHTSRARLQAEMLNAKAAEVLERIKAQIAARMAQKKDWLRDDRGEIDYGIFVDLVDYGVTKLAAGVTQFAAWSQEMIQQFGETIRPVLKDIYEAAKARQRNPELTQTPASPGTEAALRALDKRIASQELRDRVRGDLDVFNAFLRKTHGVLQWHWLNPHIPELRQYINTLTKWTGLANRWRSIASDTIRDWNKLSHKQRKSLEGMLYEATLLSDKLGRELTDKERVEIAKEHGVNESGMHIYQRIRLDMLQALSEEEHYERERIKQLFADSNDPAALATALAEHDKSFAAQRNKEYFPLARHGRFTLIVRAKEKVKVGNHTYAPDEIVYAEFFERRWLGQRARQKSALQAQFPADKFDVYTDRLPESTESFVGYSPAFYNAIEEKLHLTEDQRKDLRELVLKSSPAQAFIQHMNRRRGVKGFSMDAPRAYADYFSRFSNHIARLAYRDEFNETINQLGRSAVIVGQKTGKADKRRQIHDALRAHFEDIMHPKNYAPILRAFAYMMYFMVNAKQAVVNLTQLPVFAYSYFSGTLAQDGMNNGVADAVVTATMTKACYDAARMYQGKLAGVAGAAVGALAGSPLGLVGAGVGAHIGGAVATKLVKQGEFATKGYGLTEREVRLLKRAHEMGLYEQGYATELASISHGSSIIRGTQIESIDNLMRATVETGTLMHRVSEQFNRIVTLLTAFRLAESRGLSEEGSIDFAREAIWRTMFAHESWARPELLRNKMSVVTIFKSFLQNAIFAMGHNPGRMRSWIMMGMLGGLLGLPFADDLMSLIDWAGTLFMKRFFKGDPRLDLEKSAREFMNKLEIDPDLLLHGLARNSFGFPYLEAIGIPGIPDLDFSTSLSMGRIIPGLEPIEKASLGMLDAKDFTYRMMQEAFGVVGTMGNGVMRYSFDDSKEANLFFRLIMPQFIKTASQALEAQNKGVITDNRRNELIKFDINNLEHRAEILGMTLGARPTRMAKMQDAEWARLEAAKFYFAWREGIISDLASAKMQGDEGKDSWNRSLTVLKRYNASVPSGLQISVESVIKAVQSRKEGRALDGLGLPTKKEYYQLWQSFNPGYGGTKP